MYANSIYFGLIKLSLFRQFGAKVYTIWVHGPLNYLTVNYHILLSVSSYYELEYRIFKSRVLLRLQTLSPKPQRDVRQRLQRNWSSGLGG